MDKIDTNIISALIQDSRQSYTSIAKKLRISKSSLIYRLQLLDKSHILAYRTIIDYSTYDLLYIRVGLKGATIIGDSLKTEFEISYCAPVHGMFDYVIGFYVSSIYEANAIILRIQQVYADKIDSVHTSIGIATHHCFPIVLGTKQAPIKVSYGVFQNKLHPLDKQLLRALELNSRANISSLATRLGVTSKTIIARKRNLEKAGIIAKYTLSLRNEAYGYEQAHIYWQLKCDANMSKFRNYLLSHERVTYVIDVLGGTIECEMLIKNHKELYQIIADIKSQFEFITEFSYFVYD